MKVHPCEALALPPCWDSAARGELRVSSCCFFEGNTGRAMAVGLPRHSFRRGLGSEPFPAVPSLRALAGGAGSDWTAEKALCETPDGGKGGREAHSDERASPHVGVQQRLLEVCAGALGWTVLPSGCRGGWRSLPRAGKARGPELQGSSCLLPASPQPGFQWPARALPAKLGFHHPGGRAPRAPREGNAVACHPLAAQLLLGCKCCSAGMPALPSAEFPSKEPCQAHWALDTPLCPAGWGGPLGEVSSVIPAPLKETPLWPEHPQLLGPGSWSKLGRGDAHLMGGGEGCLWGGGQGGELMNADSQTISLCCVRKRSCKSGSATDGGCFCGFFLICIVSTQDSSCAVKAI